VQRLLVRAAQSVGLTTVVNSSSARQVLLEEEMRKQPQPPSRLVPRLIHFVLDQLHTIGTVRR
jgi:hypothetical protein